LKSDYALMFDSLRWCLLIVIYNAGSIFIIWLCFEV